MDNNKEERKGVNSVHCREVLSTLASVHLYRPTA